MMLVMDTTNQIAHAADLKSRLYSYAQRDAGLVASAVRRYRRCGEGIDRLGRARGRERRSWAETVVIDRMAFGDPGVPGSSLLAPFREEDAG